MNTSLLLILLILFRGSVKVHDDGNSPHNLGLQITSDLPDQSILDHGRRLVESSDGRRATRPSQKKRVM